MSNITLDNAIARLLEDIKEDYKAGHIQSSGHIAEYSEEMIKNFDESVEIHPGRKYIKIIVKRSVWGFIVSTDTDSKFRQGDILMDAGFSAPARNKARGNVLDGNYSIQWTGPNYLR